MEPLGAILVSRGFEWGWQPHWMAAALPLRVRPSTAGVEQASETRPGVWRARAMADGEQVGEAWAHLPAGDLVAGIYDVDVRPAHRRRGLGSGLTMSVAEAVMAAGARTVTLNATPEGEQLYRSLEFRSAGWGQTWWLHHLPGRITLGRGR